MRNGGDARSRSRGGGVRRVRGPLRRWRGLLCAVGLLAALAAVDARLKTGGGGGYCPEEAVWILAAEDFPSFWKGFVESNTVRAFNEQAPDWLGRFQLATRKLTGIRPTPTRWRVWLGNTFLAAGCAEGVGLCVRPGILLRVVHAFREVFQGVEATEGVFAFGPLSYAWREQFFIVSDAPGYVRACLSAQAPALEESHAPDEIRLCSTGHCRGFLRIRGEDELPVAGWINMNTAHRARPLTLPNAWPDDPIAAITASRWTDMRAVAAWALDFCHSQGIREEIRGMWEAVLHQWELDSLPKDWDAAVDECSLAITALDTDETLPVPEVAAVMRTRDLAEGPHPLQALVADRDALPYEWGDTAGWIAPWLSEKLAPCLACSGRDWLVTSQEPVMARLVGRLGQGAPVEADIALRIDWQRLADCGQRLVRSAAELELIPRMNPRDAEQKVIPYLQGIGQAGALFLKGTCVEGRLSFEGYLARPLRNE